MKVVLIHCYSDRNAGDLGIMLATVSLLRQTIPGVSISAISTFEEKDPFYKQEHNELHKKVDALFPAILGRAFGREGLKRSVFVKLLVDLPKLFLLLFGGKLLPRNLCRFLLGRKHRDTFDEIVGADLVISKGGSFLCSTKGAAGTMRFLRILSTLSLASAINDKTVIWGQSLGPVEGFVGRLLFNQVLARCALVIVRETNCLSAYPYIVVNSGKLVQGRDLAFNLDTSCVIEQFVPASGEVRIGITIKRFGSAQIDEHFSKALKQYVEHCVRELNAKVLLIPHVTIDDDPRKSREFYDSLPVDVRAHVSLLEKTYSINELLAIYGSLTLIVGTRLHSTIFAMAAGTPAINIGYHGTKSIGVYSAMELGDFVIEGADISTEKIVELSTRILESTDIRSIIAQRVDGVRAKNLAIARRFAADFKVSSS